ncbi:MAG: holo-ACP synthase [Candidatus Poribacteria bacterium]|nr:holo-ACP synthase [Candidatus Poribacteria bacterium]
MPIEDIETGVDLIEIEQVERALERWGERFKKRVYTDSEQAYCDSRVKPSQSYAARFAAKEAAMKALGTGWNGVDWKEIEVTRNRRGKPSIQFHRRAQAVFERMNGQAARLSLSHTEGMAIAHVALLLG